MTDTRKDGWPAFGIGFVAGMIFLAVWTMFLKWIVIWV